MKDECYDFARASADLDAAISRAQLMVDVLPHWANRMNPSCIPDDQIRQFIYTNFQISRPKIP